MVKVNKTRLEAIKKARAAGKTIVPITLYKDDWGRGHTLKEITIDTNSFPWSCGYVVATFVGSSLRTPKVKTYFDQMLWELCNIQGYNACVLTDVTTGRGKTRKHRVTGTFAVLLAEKFPKLCMSFPVLRNLNSGNYIQMHHVHLSELRNSIYFDTTMERSKETWLW